MIVIDRLEDETAVLEIGGRLVDVPRSELPEGAREGDRLSFVLEARPDLSEAEERLARLRAATPQGPGEFDL